LAEARTALKEGKKVSQAKVRVAAAGLEWKATVKAEGLEFTGVRAPQTMDPDAEESEGLGGRFLDRAAVMQEFLKIMDGFYASFLAVRLNEAWKKRELPRLRKWLQEY
jgi:recombination associated protein RdgC